MASLLKEGNSVGTTCLESPSTAPAAQVSRCTLSRANGERHPSAAQRGTFRRRGEVVQNCQSQGQLYSAPRHCAERRFGRQRSQLTPAHLRLLGFLQSFYPRLQLLADAPQHGRQVAVVQGQKLLPLHIVFPVTSVLQVLSQKAQSVLLRAHSRGVACGVKSGGVHRAASREAGAGDVCGHPSGVLQSCDTRVNGRDRCRSGIAPVGLCLAPGIAGQFCDGATQNMTPAQWCPGENPPELPRRRARIPHDGEDFAGARGPSHQSSSRRL